MAPHKDTGARVREIRQQRGYSQVELAAKAGCSLTTVSLAERLGFLTSAMAQRFAAALQVRPEDLRA